MSIINKGTSFSNGEQLTAKKINDMVDLATFDQSATDSTSTTVNSSSQIIVRDGGIIAGKLATDAVETAKIKNSTDKTDGVTLPKIQSIDTAKVLGRTTAGEGNVEELDFKTETDMVSDSDTAVASQKSIKAYVDASSKGIVQFVLGSATSQVSTTDSIPFDDTAPLISEGVSTGISVTMTPTSTANTIRATLDGYFRNSNATNFVIISLFEGNTCVGVSQLQQPSNGNTPGTMTYYFNAASTSEQTYTVRFGAHSGGTATMDTTPTFGGLSRTTLFLEEIST